MAAASISNNLNEKPAWLTKLEISLQRIRCSRCLNSPEFTCKKDKKHNLCRKCISATTAGNSKLLCPVCRSDVSELSELIMELLLKGLPRRKCKFSKCNYSEIAVEKVEAHENDCPHRELPCYQCDDKPVPLSGWADHIITEHKEKAIIRTQQNQFALVRFYEEITTSSSLEPVKTERKQKTFVYRVCDAEQNNTNITFFCHMVEKDAHFLIWVAHDQSKNSKRAYKYSITLFDVQVNVHRRFVRYSGFCQPADITVQEMSQEMNCLVVPARTMRDTIMDYDYTLVFELSLNRTYNNSL